MADKKKRGGIATLSDLRNNHDSDSDEGPQEYYTGGEKSGMMVQDPSKQRKDVDAFLERARQIGAREVDGEAVRQASSSAPFTGTGRTLSGDPQPAQAAAGNDATGDENQPPVVHVITFWRNGFTVNDGPLRRLDDPANASFMQSLDKGQVPRELDVPPYSMGPVDIHLVKRDEEWKAEEGSSKKLKAFTGAARTLGSSATAASSEMIATAEAAAGAASPFRGIVVDELKPFTSLQLRLADGTRMVARFNNHHTVADIRGFIDSARLGGPKLYSLQVMGFPPKLLTDPSLTIDAAGLTNAVIIQKSS